MQIFDSTNFKSGSALLVEVLAGQWAGFLIRLSGLNDTGNTAGSNFGRIRLNRNGVELLNLDADILQLMNDVDYGFIESTSTISSTYNQSIYIPASVFPFAADHNIFHVTEDDQLTITITYDSTIQGLLASGTLVVGGNYQLGIEHYTPLRLQETPNIPAGTTPHTFKSARNFIGLYFDYTNTTRLLVEVNGGVFINGSIAELQALSNLLTQKEATYSSLCKLDVTQGQSQTEQLSDELKVTWTVSAAETPRCVAVGLAFDKNRENKSRQWFLEKHSQRIRRILIAGHTVPSPTVPKPVPVPIPEKPTPTLA